MRLELLCLAPLRRSEITACPQMVCSAVAALAPHPYSPSQVTAWIDALPATDAKWWERCESGVVGGQT